MMNLERDILSLVRLVSNVTEAYSACLFLEDKKRKTYQLASYHSLSPHIIADASVEAGQGFMGWVLENNEPLSVNQFDKDTIVLGYYSRNESIKSFMAAPLPSSLNKGALAIDSKKSWCFTSRDQKILAGFAQQFAYLADGALAAAQLEQRSMSVSALSGYLTSLRSSEDEDQLLNAICQVPRELLPFDACFLVLMDEEAGFPRLVRTSGFGELFLSEVTVGERTGLAGYVLSKKESLRLTDLRGPKGVMPLFHHNEPRLEARSAACIPLLSQGRALGCMGFTSKQPAQFGPSSLKRGEIIAGPGGGRRRESQKRVPLAGVPGNRPRHPAGKTSNISIPAFRKSSMTRKPGAANSRCSASRPTRRRDSKMRRRRRSSLRALEISPAIRHGKRHSGSS